MKFVKTIMAAVLLTAVSSTASMAMIDDVVLGGGSSQPLTFRGAELSQVLADTSATSREHLNPSKRLKRDFYGTFKEKANAIGITDDELTAIESFVVPNVLVNYGGLGQISDQVFTECGHFKNRKKFLAAVSGGGFVTGIDVQVANKYGWVNNGLNGSGVLTWKRTQVFTDEQMIKAGFGASASAPSPIDMRKAKSQGWVSNGLNESGELTWKRTQVLTEPQMVEFGF